MFKLWEWFKDKTNKLAERLKPLNNIRIIALCVNFVWSLSNKEKIVSGIGWISFVMFGLMQKIDWYWAIMISIPALAGGLYIYERFFKRKKQKESPLKIEFEELFFDPIENMFEQTGREKDDILGIHKYHRLYYCRICSACDVENVSVDFIRNKIPYKLTFTDVGKKITDIAKGPGQRVNLISYSNKGTKYKKVHIEGTDKDFDIEFRISWIFEVEVSAKGQPPKREKFNATLNKNGFVDFKLIMDKSNYDQDIKV